MTASGPQTFGEMVGAIGRWLRTNTSQVVLYAVLGAAGGYLFNTLLLMFAYDGYRVPTGRVGVGEGNVLLGSLGIAMATTIGFSLFGYARSVGMRQFARDLAALPRQVGVLVRRDGAGAFGHLLWGAAVALLARQVIGPGFGAMLAVGLLVYLPSLVGQVVVRLGMRVVYAIARLVRPGEASGPASVTVAVGVLGTIAALAAGYFVRDTTLLLIAAVACGVGAFALSRGATPTQAASLIAALVLPALLFADVPFALADDGGWWEQPGEGSITNWLRSAGATTVLIWGGGAVPSAVAGAAVGGAVGGIMSGGGWDFSSLIGAGVDAQNHAEEISWARESEMPEGLDIGETRADMRDIGDLRDVPPERITEADAHGERVIQDPAHWFDGPPPTGDPEGRVIRDDASAFGGTPRFVDPDSGEPLVVQDGTYEGGEIGMVWYDEWVTPEEAARRIAERKGEIAAREREIEAWQRETDEAFARNRAQREERYAAEREAEAQARADDEARRAREARLDAGLDRLMEARLSDPGWMERWEEAQDDALEGDTTGLETLYRETLREEIQDGVATAEAEERYEQALAVGEWAARGVEMGARGALMAVGGQVVAAHGVATAIGASALGMGSIQGASEGAEAQAQGKDATEIARRTAGGFLSGAKDGAVGTITGLPGTSAPVRVLLPAVTDAAETYVRTGDAGRAVVSGVIGAAGGAAGEGVDAVLGPGAGRNAAGAIVNATAAGATSVAVHGGTFQEGFVQGLASDIATRAGGSLGNRAAGHSAETVRAETEAAQELHQAAQTEQRARDALAEGHAQRTAPTTLEQQSAAVQALAQTQHDRVRLGADGRPVVDADGNPVTDSYVNSRQALDQLRDTRGSRTGKTLDDPNAPGLRDAIVRTRTDDLYGPADRATIESVTPRLQEAGILQPGDRLVMDPFSTPGKPPSLGADRDARLVIERPRVDGNGQPVRNADGNVEMQRIEVRREHWEQQALSDFYRHTHAIATEGGRAVTPETHPDYYERMREGLERQGRSREEVAQMTPDQVLQESGEHGRHHAWAEAHNQLFTDRFHVEASRGNTDQGVQRVVGEDGAARAEAAQVASNTLDVKGGGARLADPEGYARMWQEKSEFYRNNPAEALAQSQKGVAEMMDLRDGYRQQGLEPPPLNPRAAQAMEIIGRAPVGVDATPAAMAQVESQLQAIGYRSTAEAMTAVAWQNEGLKWSRPATVAEGPPGLRTSQVGALTRDETAGY